MLTVAAVAQRLGLKEPTIRVWIANGRITYVKLGRAVRIAEEEVAKFIRDNTISAKQTK